MFPVLTLFIALIIFGDKGVSAILYVVQEAEITARMRGYIEARYSGTPLEYLMNCRYCLSFWAAFLVASAFSAFSLLLDISVPITAVLCILLTLVIYGTQLEKLKKEDSSGH